jgi:hypothetical protein
LKLVLLESHENREVASNIMRLKHLTLGHDLVVDGVLPIFLDVEEKPKLPSLHRFVGDNTTVDQRDKVKMPTRDLNGVSLIHANSFR